VSGRLTAEDQVNALVKQAKRSPDRWLFGTTGSHPSVGRSDLQKPCSRGVWWAREELNLRPLPCQIQRASTSLYLERVETGKDHEKAAAYRTSQHPDPPTIRPGSPRVALVTTAISCCPSAARARLAGSPISNANQPEAGCLRFLWSPLAMFHSADVCSTSSP
jgi:hypothetical protein